MSTSRSSTVPKGMPCKYHHDKTGGVYDMGLRVADIVINKQVEDKILAKRRSECVECGKQAKS